jgi:hypothetical protein
VGWSNDFVFQMDLDLEDDAYVAGATEDADGTRWLRALLVWA